IKNAYEYDYVYILSCNNDDMCAELTQDISKIKKPNKTRNINNNYNNIYDNIIALNPQPTDIIILCKSDHNSDKPAEFCKLYDKLKSYRTYLFCCDNDNICEVITNITRIYPL